MGHVVEEADETVYWLALIRESGTCGDQALASLQAEAAELSAIFNQSQLTAKRRAAIRTGSRSPVFTHASE